MVCVCGQVGHSLNLWHACMCVCVCMCVCEQVGHSLNVWCVCVEQVGLAVDDIKAVQEQAALKRMAMQVKRLSSQFVTEACRINLVSEECRMEA